MNSNHARLFALMSAACLLCGCAHKSFNPWLGEEHLVPDDRMAGVWQGIDEAGSEPEFTELFIIRPVTELPDRDDESNEVPAGYYALTWIDNDEVELEATVEHIFIRPKNLFAGLYQVDTTLLAQVWGNTVGGNPLVAPMHVIYKVREEGDLLYLHDMNLDNLEEADLLAQGLLFEAKEDNPLTFFSPTEALTRFIQQNLDQAEFFSEEPTLILRRLRDLRKPEIEVEGEDNKTEELEPVP